MKSSHFSSAEIKGALRFKNCRAVNYRIAPVIYDHIITPLYNIYNNDITFFYKSQ